MNALDALRMARDVGVRVWIDGDDLVLEAVAAPPPTVIDLLSRHKAAILRELRETANDTVPAVPATQYSQETFEFAPPGDLANDDEALRERVAIMMKCNGWDAATARQEARWQADRERCWRAFLRNAQRVLDAPAHQRERLLALYQIEAARRYGQAAGAGMAGSLRAWLEARGVH